MGTSILNERYRYPATLLRKVAETERKEKVRFEIETTLLQFCQISIQILARTRALAFPLPELFLQFYYPPKVFSNQW